MSATERTIGIEPPPLLGTVFEPQRATEQFGWPITRLGSWSLTCVLCLSMAAPMVVFGTTGSKGIVLLPFAVLAAVGVRALFESLASHPMAPSMLGRAAVVLTPTLVGAAMMAGATAVIAGRWSPLAGLGTTAMTAVALIVAGALRSVEVRFDLGLRHVYFIGSETAGRDLELELGRRPDARLVGRTLMTDEQAGIDRVSLNTAVLDARTSVLVLDNRASQVPELAENARLLTRAGVQVCDLASYYEQRFKKVPLTELSPTWFQFESGIGDRRINGLLRRAAEVVLAAALLLLAVVPLLVCAVLIKLTSRGPVLYRQPRVGKDDFIFTLLKLRTMSVSADEEAVWAPSQVHRVTLIGRHCAGSGSTSCRSCGT